MATKADVLPEVSTKDLELRCVYQKGAVLGKTILNIKPGKDQNNTATRCNSVPEGSQWGSVTNGSFMLDVFENKTANVPQIRPAGQH